LAQSGRSSFLSEADAPWEMRIISVLKICSYIGMACVVVMTFVTFAHSVGRYGFDAPIPGLVEISKILLIMAIFMISAYTMIEKGHIAVGLLIDRMSPRKQAIVDTVTFSIALVVSAIALWRTIVKGIYVIEQNPVSSVLRIPDGPFVMIVAFGWAILAIAIFLHLRHMVIRGVGK